jgi:hypothetical protein
MTTTLTEIAAIAVEQLDATGQFDARLWLKASPRFVRVYVQTTDRKRKDCGYFTINSDATVDYSNLCRSKGGIKAIVEDAIDAALPNLPAAPQAKQRARRCDECGYTSGHRMDCALA